MDRIAGNRFGDFGVMRRERRPGASTRAASEPTSRANAEHNGRTSPNRCGDRLDWKADVLPVAAEIVESYDTLITLRQLFYRLVSRKPGERGRIPNTYSMYTALAHNTADARYEGRFPELVDQRRKIVSPLCYGSPADALEQVRGYYRRDRTGSQPHQVWLGTEKSGMVTLLQSWFADLGVPIIALGGQTSQPYVQQITRRVAADGRPAILLYAGDHDPAGWSILRNFVDRTGCWDNPDLPGWDTATMPEHLGRKRGHARKWQTIPNFNRYRKFRVALTPEQCVDYDLARNPAKDKDPNLETFVLNFGDTLTDDEVDGGCGVQVEVDALEPPVLRQLYSDAIGRYWDAEVYGDVVDREADDLAELDRIILNMYGDDEP